MKNRFTGDHGYAFKLILQDTGNNNNMAHVSDSFGDTPSGNGASSSNSSGSGMGIQLDQTKAYDLINPRYLTNVLLKFGFPLKFIDSINRLFFDNQILINVNGFLSNSVPQKRGLRQGDSILPILFNLAIEPFLLPLSNTSNFSGYCLTSRLKKFNNTMSHLHNNPTLMLC
jgi:hypothetical protein